MAKYEDRTVEELQDLLRERGESVSGSKAELIDRLRGGGGEAKAEQPEQPAVVDGPLDARAILEVQAAEGNEAAQATLERIKAKEDAAAAREKAKLDYERIAAGG